MRLTASISARVAWRRTKLMFEATDPSKRKFSCSTTPSCRRYSASRRSARSRPSTRTRPAWGRLNAMIRLTRVLFPDPLDPTSAVVLPAGASSETSLSTGTPSV